MVVDWGRNEIIYTLFSVGLPNLLEPPGLSRNYDKRPDRLTMIP